MTVPFLRRLNIKSGYHVNRREPRSPYNQVLQVATNRYKIGFRGK